jgi:hypothetical protein
MDELETNFFVGLSWHFGGGKPYMSGTAGVGVSRRFKFVDPGVNLAVNFYDNGIGTRDTSDKLHFDTVLSGKVTAGYGNGNPMSVYPLHVDSGTGLEDRYKVSATVGTNLIFNNSGRNQHVGFVQLRAGDVSFQTYNDFGGFKKIGISDGYDRWWTGGGNLTLGSKESNYQLIIASDVFTADTDSSSETDRITAQQSLESFNASNTGSWLEQAGNRAFDYTPATATEVDTKFLKDKRDNIPWSGNQHSFNLNQGRTSFRLRTPEGAFGVNGLGAGHMFSQDIIHRTINFHLIPSERPNHWEFQYSPNLNKGF